MNESFTVASWNVLAAPWAAPAFYPAEMDPALLDRVTRRALVAARLAELDADVVCLQETTPVDLLAIADALGPDVAVHAAPNAPELWAGWSTEELPWEANGTAVLWRRDRFDGVETGAFAMSDDGNVATTFAARLAGTDTQVRVRSVHLDVDRPDLRRAQLHGALAALGLPGTHAGIDVVAGDCNEDTDGTDLGTIAAEHGLFDALTAVGVTDPTHPLARPGDDHASLARLDHVLVRGARPVGGRVVDAGLFAVDDAGTRWIEGLRRTGSDHLALVATITLAS